MSGGGKDQYFLAEIKSGRVVVHKDKPVTRKEALTLIKKTKYSDAEIKKGTKTLVKGLKNIWTEKKLAKSLAKQLSGGKKVDGKATHRDNPKKFGQMKHIHDCARAYAGHIFYGK